MKGNVLNFKGKNTLLWTWAPRTAQRIKGRLKVMAPLIPVFPRRPSDSLCGPPLTLQEDPVTSSPLTQRSRKSYLAAVSHQAPGREDWHTESRRLDLLSAFWLTKHPPTSSRPQSEPRVLFKDVSSSLWLTFWIHLGRMYQDPLNPTGMLNSVKRDVVKKANNMPKDVHCKWLRTSKRLINLHFKKLAGGNISAYLISTPHIHPASKLAIHWQWCFFLPIRTEY